MQEDEKKTLYDGTPNDMTPFAFKLIKFCSILLGKKLNECISDGLHIQFNSYAFNNPNHTHRLNHNQ